MTVLWNVFVSERKLEQTPMRMCTVECHRTLRSCVCVRAQSEMYDFFEVSTNTLGTQFTNEMK